MRRIFRVAAILVLLFVSVCFALLGFGLLRAPSAQQFAVYLTTEEKELGPQGCDEFGARLETMQEVMRFKPVLLAADGENRSFLSTLFRESRSGHYSSQIARHRRCHLSESNLRHLIDEMLLAIKIDLVFSADERLTIYLNQVYVDGEKAGIASAAELYFHKPLNALTLAERALLVGLLRSPQALSPLRHADRALARRNSILAQMKESGAVTAQEANEAMASPLGVSAERDLPMHK